MPRVSPDRLSISAGRIWFLTALLIGQLWAALSSVVIDAGSTTRAADLIFPASFLCAVLSMFGLRTIAVRRIVRSVSLLSGFLLAGFGQLGSMDGVVGSSLVLAWLGLTGLALVLAPSSRSIVTFTPQAALAPADIPASRANDLSSSRDRSGAISSRRALRRRRLWKSAPPVIVVSAAMLLTASGLLVGPYIANRFPAGPSAGDLVDRSLNRPTNVMAARDTLDMTSRPELTDKVVMTVRSPLAAFWRTETFDAWNGREWSRSAGGYGLWVTKGDRIEPSPDDIAATRGATTQQEFRLQVGFATAIPSASSPVGVESVQPLARRPDGTLVSPLSPLGRNSTYTVQSRQMPVDAELLAQVGSARDRTWQDDAVVNQVRQDYAAKPVTTPRVRQLAAKVTSGARDDFERVTGIEDWLRRNTRYSVDAPLAPRNVDVVDDFLFESKVGWCEQIASSLVVMAREVGVPARIVTGFAPGTWDSVGNRFVVRERDAHAWAEVWFPEVGWVTFDPTSAVPFSGSQSARAGAGATDWRTLAGAVLAVVGVVLFATGPLGRRFAAMIARLWRRFRSARRQRRQIRAGGAAELAVRLERIGRSKGRSRLPSETLTAYSAAVSDLVADPAMLSVGSTLDRVAYRQGEATDPDEVAELSRILTAHET